jgi:CBS domain-containing protein
MAWIVPRDLLPERAGATGENTVDPQQANKTAREFLVEKPRSVIAVSPDDTVLQALKVMAEKDIGAVLVMRGQSIAGIFSERDYARKVEIRGKTAANTPVREVMTEKVVFATPTNTVVQCMALMKQKRIRHLPVVDGARVVGVLSARDVLEEVIAEEEVVLKDLQHERLFYTGDTGGTY